jgi:exosortase
MTQLPVTTRYSPNRAVLAALAAGILVLVWCYWTTLCQVALRWGQDPMYSHGYLVPGFALALLWFRRGHLAAGELRPSWWGVPLLLAGLGLRAYGTYFYYVWDDQISLLVCVAGVVLTVGGARAWRWAWPAVAFLAFMIPLPYRLAVAMTGPLQQLATVCSTFLMQTLAMPALADGNVIRLNDVELNIVEACSGLRMLVIFFALSTAVALVIRRPLWQKVALVASAVPIALLVNVLRITATGVLHEMASSEVARAVFHDLAGWLMMPVALGLMWLELIVLGRLVIEPKDTGPRLVAANRPVPPASASTRKRPGRRRKWQPVQAGTRPGGLA